MVMNFNFDKPSARMKEMANKNKINLKDESVIEEFKLIQKQNLEDIRRLRQGLPPLTEEEQREQRQKEHAARESKRIEERQKETERITKLMQEQSK